jgi:predicted nucleic acid-binding protein
VIILDTSGLLCLLDSGEKEHARAVAAVEVDPGPLVTIDFVLAETDFLVLKRLGSKAERAFISQLISGAIQREAVTPDDLVRALAISRRFHDQNLGLTDAAVMALTERLETRKVLTLDRRHFAPFRDRRGRALDLLP